MIEESFEEDTLDVTERITVYKHGKTFNCDCGQGIGVGLDRVWVKCANCKKVCYDMEADMREPAEREFGQTGLDQWT